MTHGVGFWLKLRRLGSSDLQIKQWHALYIEDVIYDSKQQESDRWVGW